MEKVLIDLKLDNCLTLMQEQIYKKRKPLDEYCDMIARHSFSVDSVLHDKFKYKFVDGTRLFNHYFIRLAFIDGWKDFIPIENQEDVFDRVESKLNEQSDIDGIYSLSVPFVLIDCKRQ